MNGSAIQIVSTFWNLEEPCFPNVPITPLKVASGMVEHLANNIVGFTATRINGPKRTALKERPRKNGWAVRHRSTTKRMPNDPSPKLLWYLLL